jgi:hypothetical protein
MLQVVDFTGFGRKNVEHDVPVVLQEPSTALVAFDPQPRGTFLAEHPIDFIGDGAHLPGTVPGGHDEIIENRRDGGEIQYNRVLATVIVRHPGTKAGVFQTGFYRRDIGSLGMIAVNICPLQPGPDRFIPRQCARIPPVARVQMIDQSESISLAGLCKP